MNRDQQKTRVIILSISGLLLAGTAGGWVYFNHTRQSDFPANLAGAVNSEVPGARGTYKPAVNVRGAGGRAPGHEFVSVVPIPVAPPVVLNIPAAPLRPPAVPTPVQSTTSRPPVGPGAVSSTTSSLPGPPVLTAPPDVPNTSNPVPGDRPPVALVTPPKVNAAAAPLSPELNAAAVSAERSRRALELYKKRKQAELYAFLFNNAPAPRAEGPPSGVVNKKGQAVVPATTRLDAIAAAKKSISLTDDPCQTIDGKEFKPLGVKQANAKVDWRLVLLGKGKGPNIPNAPNPSFPEVPAPPNTPLLTPPEPPGATVFLPEQLPLPPDRPTANLDDLKLTAIMDDTAIFLNRGGRVILNVGDEYEGLKLIKVTADGATLDDGYRSYTKTL